MDKLEVESREVQPSGERLADVGQHCKGAKANSSNAAPCMGNFSIQYNITSASIAVAVLADSEYLGRPASEAPEWSSNITLPIVFVGAMLGMLCMGRLGDVIGRTRAMRITLLFTILGAIIPALAIGAPDVIYIAICFGRLVLGVGVGGLYPLSAVASAQGQRDRRRRAYTVSGAFFWQSVGVVVPYLLALVMLALPKPEPPEEWVPMLEFRLLFALGVVPALITAALSMPQREECQPVLRHKSIFKELRMQPPDVKWTLVGTACSWLLYGVAYYGTAIFTPIILQDIFSEQTLFRTSWNSVVIALMGIPGMIAAILLVERWGCKKLNVIGFLAMAGCFGLMAVTWGSIHPTAMFVLFAILNYLLSFGPSLGTYVLPALCFPSGVQSTCHGMSAFGGKLGAMVGAFLFPLIRQSPLGITGVLWMQTVACLLGAFISHRFLKNDWEYICPDEDLMQNAVGLSPDGAIGA